MHLGHWDLSEKKEFIDETHLGADQVIHLGMHLLMSHHLPGPHVQQRLWGECVASSMDLASLGKLLSAQVDTPFVHETLESLEFHYQIYGNADDVAPLLTACCDDPFRVTRDTATYHYRLGMTLLNRQRPDRDAVAHTYYPLAHHFNLGNWVLFLRNTQPAPFHDLPDSFVSLVFEVDQTDHGERLQDLFVSAL